MNYRWLGKTGVQVSVLSLGGSVFGSGFGSVSGVDDRGAKEIVTRALDAGINSFDTADEYSKGESEEILGRALRGRRDDVVLATKVGFRVASRLNAAGSSRKHVLHQLNASLKRLGTDYIDLYYVHIHDEHVAVDDLMATLDMVVRAGKVRYVGVSNYPAWRLVEGIHVAASYGWTRFASYQALWNLLDRAAEDEIVPACRSYGLGFFSWSPLAGGWLTGKYRRGEPRPAGARLAGGAVDYLGVDEGRAYAAVELLEEIGARHGATASQIALAWQLARPWLTSAVVGAKSMAQLEENLGAVDVELDEAELAQLDEAFPKPRRWPAWQLEQTEPSRQGLAP
jgi:aryl-alcohol dehydrogenase-like predicted oxidoreductase